MKVTLLAAFASCILLTGGLAGPADASIRKTTNIPAESLSDALRTLAKDRQFEILYRAEVVRDVRTEGAIGEFTPEEALKAVLSGTGLAYKYLDANTVTVFPQSSLQVSTSGQSNPTSDASTESSTKEVGKKSSQEFRLVQVDQGANSRPATVANSTPPPQDESSRAQLTEIVVTAEKRSERLIDVPQSVSVLSWDDLAKLGATQLRDFANTVPGMSLTTAGTGYTQITLRGVTTGFDLGSTVGIYVDDVPYGSSSPFADGPRTTLDSALFDLDHIEVLRGPQGTLYGASTMGGLLKYVTKRPDATDVSGDAQSGVSATGDGGGVNFNTAASVNLPIITNIAAVGASGFESHEGGYINNVALDQRDVNRSNVYGGRLDLLLTPTDALSVRLNGFLQNITRDGEGTADYTFTGAQRYGALGQYRLIEEPFDQHFRIVSGTVTYNLQWASLTSISSYQTMNSNFAGDLTAGYAAYCGYAGYTCSALGYDQETSTDKFTQEVRLASEGSQTLEWLVGAFYTHEKSDLAQQYLPYVDGVRVPNNLFTYDAPSTFEEYAGFGDLTVHLGPKFDVTGGVRYASNDQDKSQVGSGIFGLSHPTVSSNGHEFTYLGDARYHFTDHDTGYIRYATGYRPGGPNLVTRNPNTGEPNGPATFQPDKLQSYEVGFKSETADHRLGIDIALYYINWQNLQVTVSEGGFSTIENAAGGATVRGAELGLTAVPMDALKLNANFAYQDPKLKQAEPNLGTATYGGEPLPNVPKYSSALNADYSLPFASSWQPTVGATARYEADRETGFNGGAALGFPQYHLPGYVMFDLRSGITLNSLNLQFLVRNVLDRRSQLSAYTWRGLPEVAVAQPRTIGVQAHYSF